MRRIEAHQKRAPLLLLALSLVALGACARKPGAEAADAGPSGTGSSSTRTTKHGKDAPVAVEPTVLGPESVATVKREHITTGPRLAGTLEAARKAVLRSEIGGEVVIVNAEVGDVVRWGQMLMSVQASAEAGAFDAATAGVHAAEEDLNVATRQAERVRRLTAAGALSVRDRELADAERVASAARLEQAKAQYEQAAVQIGEATVHAPFAGIVAERAVGKGDMISPGAVVYTVIDPSSMRLTASVPSDALGAIHPGSSVAFSVRGYPSQQFTGVVSRVAPAVDPGTRQVTVLVAIPNPGGQLLAGLYAEGRVVSEERESLVVPSGAVQADGETRVLRVVNEVVEAVPVKTGIVEQQQERTEIVSGLNEGDVVLTGAGLAVGAGARVKLVANGAR